MVERVREPLTDGDDCAIMEPMARQGLTLIELLVVITIISVLTAIGMSTFQNSQRRARDAARRAGVAQIQNAAEQFYLECDEYPSNQAAFVSAATGCAGGVAQYLEGGSFSSDPRGGASDTYAVVSATTASYRVCADLELDPPNDIVDASWTASQNEEDFCKSNLQ